MTFHFISLYVVVESPVSILVSSKKRISEKATKKIDIILPVAQKGIPYDIYCGNTLILSQNLTANKTSDMELKLQKPTAPLPPLRTNKT